MTIVAKTVVKRVDDEYIVRAYDAAGARLADCDYYTDDAEDAYNTASFMLTGLDVESVYCAHAFRRVNAEDGAYDAIAGHNVFVNIVDAAGRVHVFGYAGENNPNGRDGLQVFANDAILDAFVARVKAAGHINAADYWALIEVRDPNELPDYAVNPDRPEYN